jgi:glycerophosphoryl diester phosphodiesterase
MRAIRTIGAIAAVTGLSGLAAMTTASASADGQQPTLEGRAVLPAQALAMGPPSGALYVPDAKTGQGVTMPRPSQPVAGFSGIVAGRSPGEYLAMPDNGFGTKANSRDFLIRAYYIRPDFKTARGGSGTVEVGDFISFRDPHRRIGFPIVNENTLDRLLTGADIDPESLQRGKDGDYWVGDEFGPWILHFDRNGVLLDAPFPMPGGLMSPNNPHLGGATATQPNSRGVEAMAIAPDGKHLYAILEGATVADPDQRRRLVFEFSVRDERFTGRTWQYRTEQPGYMVADAWALDSNRLTVIERDGGLGLGAVFRNVYVVDLRRVDGGGFLTKELRVDLAQIPDPNLVSLPPIHAGDVGLGNPFRVTCESVEAVYPLSGSRLIIGCDNNLPNIGRNPVLADDNELIVVEVPGLAS